MPIASLSPVCALCAALLLWGMIVNGMEVHLVAWWTAGIAVRAHSLPTHSPSLYPSRGSRGLCLRSCLLRDGLAKSVCLCVCVCMRRWRWRSPSACTRSSCTCCTTSSPSYSGTISASYGWYAQSKTHYMSTKIVFVKVPRKARFTERCGTYFFGRCVGVGRAACRCRSSRSSRGWPCASRTR